VEKGYTLNNPSRNIRVRGGLYGPGNILYVHHPSSNGVNLHSFNFSFSIHDLWQRKKTRIIQRLFYRARLRNMMNRIRQKIAKPTASKVAQKACGPAPNPIGGSGGIHMKAPPSMDAPKKIAAIIMMIIPMNMRMKPMRNSLNGAGHGKDTNAGAPRLR